MPVDRLSKPECCGCNSCGDICPTKAIKFETDNEGFWYPSINYDLCTHCEACTKICPNLDPTSHSCNNFQDPISFGAYNKNLEIRFDSTSGGIFSAIAEIFYKEGGYVGGAVYNEDFSATQYISDKKEDLKRLRSSKYLQSNASGFYIEVKKALKTEKPVFVCGTPCQIAALYNFLGKNYANLYTADFICNSVASPLAHRKYLDYLEFEYNSKITSFKAKNKELGWRSLTKKSTFANGKSYYGIKGSDLYSRAYHSHMISRPSCYNCPFKGFPRVADISLGDFWGVEHYDKELDNNTGTSAIMINTEQGRALFEKTSKRIISKKVNVKDFFKGNPSLLYSIKEPNFDRIAFFNDLHKLNFKQLSEKYFPLQENTGSLLRQILRIGRNVKNLTRLRPKPLWQFFYLNFIHSAIKTDWKKGHLLYPTPFCIFEIDKSATVEVHGMIRLGLKKFKNSKLESRFLIGKNSKLIFQGNFRFGYGCDVEVFNGAELKLGADSGGNIGLTLICGNKIEIGSHTFYGRDVSIRDTNGGHIIAMQGYKETNPVNIGDFVWICSQSNIMPGVKVGDGSVIGSNSVVISHVPSHVLVSGHPARIIDKEIYWKH